MVSCDLDWYIAKLRELQVQSRMLCMSVDRDNLLSQMFYGRRYATHPGA